MRLTLFLALLTCLHPFAAAAQDSSSFSNISIDSHTRQVQDQAEKVYERTDYKRAFFIYRFELAPIGDKYAQYMVGYMYLTGKGVAEDNIAASAWYRLAAERDIKEFIYVSDKLMESLDADEKARSDQLFLDLRHKYGDLALLLLAVQSDYDILRSRTGSRLSAGSSPMTIISLNSGGAPSTDVDFYGPIEKRMKARLELIAAYTNIEIIDLNDMNMTAIEATVGEHLAKLD